MLAPELLYALFATSVSVLLAMVLASTRKRQNAQIAESEQTIQKLQQSFVKLEKQTQGQLAQMRNLSKSQIRSQEKLLGEITELKQKIQWSQNQPKQSAQYEHLSQLAAQGQEMAWFVESGDIGPAEASLIARIHGKQVQQHVESSRKI